MAQPTTQQLCFKCTLCTSLHQTAVLVQFCGRSCRCLHAKALVCIDGTSATCPALLDPQLYQDQTTAPYLNPQLCLRLLLLLQHRTASATGLRAAPCVS